jgi:O-antigen ligase/polysaccharide polymerase Wzy-like membrane protein
VAVRTRLERPALTIGALVLALGLPLVFLHIDYQPKLTFHVGGVAPQLDLSDLAVLAAGVAALAAGLVEGFGVLRAGLPIWVAGAALLVLIFAATAYPLASDRSYAWKTHLVTAGKFAEYALLALAVPLIVRRRRELWIVLCALVAWSVVATAFALAQFFGWDVAQAYQAGRRQPSFLGHHDFAALSGAALALALVAILLPGWRIDRRFAAVAGVSGALGLAVSGSTAAAIGLGAGAAAALLVARLRGPLPLARPLAVVAIVAVTAGGVLALRGNDFEQFVRFFGIETRQKATSQNVQTYVQHTLLAYIGVKIFLEHPVVGIGWQGSSEESGYGPYLAAAHKRFPHASPLSFPSPRHPWGVQNGYVQALADLGVVGFLLFVGLFAAGVAVAGRRALRTVGGSPLAMVALIWLLVAMGIWTAVGLVAGIPLDALTWLGVGLAATTATGALDA